MPSVGAGAFRLAAARGDLATMESLINIPFFTVEAPIGGFTALHAACVNVSIYSASRSQLVEQLTA